MNKYYNNDVSDFINMKRPKTRISLNDIYAQVYNVSEASARSMVNQYIIDHDQRVAEKANMK